MDGKRVKELQIGWGEGAEIYNFGKSDCKREAYIENLYHGTYDDNWLVVKENGKEVLRIGINNNCQILWWEAEK